MKRCWILLFVLTLMLALAACGAQKNGAPANEAPISAAPPSREPPPEEPGEEPCEHQPSQGGNVVDHEFAGYCGNTVTTVSRQDGAWDGPLSFWGDDSVALTDLLRYLDYSGDVCRCLPEYSVDTEFGADYGVNLTEGYARHDGGQTDLTEEQTEQIRAILERAAEK